MMVNDELCLAILLGVPADMPFHSGTVFRGAHTDRVQVGQFRRGAALDPR